MLRKLMIVSLVTTLIGLPVAAGADSDAATPPDAKEQAALQAMERLCPDGAGDCQKGEALMAQVRKNPRLVRHLWQHRKWLREHPTAAKAMARAMVQDRKFLADHPEIAREMFRHRRFLVRNPEVVGQLMERKRFVRKHPEVARAILEHREFVQKYPKLAKRLKRMLQHRHQHQNRHRTGK